MKKALFAVIAMTVFGGVSSISYARSLNGWHGQGLSVVLTADGGAQIQTACSFISVKNWNDDGRAMIGEESSALPTPNKTMTRLNVTAVREEDGSLDLTIGDGQTENLEEGYQPQVICG